MFYDRKHNLSTQLVLVRSQFRWAQEEGQWASNKIACYKGAHSNGGPGSQPEACFQSGWVQHREMKKEAEAEKGELGKKQGSTGRDGSGPAHATYCWKLHFKEILIGSQKGENQTATIWWYRCLWKKKSRIIQASYKKHDLTLLNTRSLEWHLWPPSHTWPAIRKGSWCVLFKIAHKHKNHRSKALTMKS